MSGLKVQHREQGVLTPWPALAPRVPPQAAGKAAPGGTARPPRHALADAASQCHEGTDGGLPESWPRHPTGKPPPTNKQLYTKDKFKRPD